MAVLAFETSTAQGSVALIEGEKILAHRMWIREKSHSELLTAEIESVLKEAGVEGKNLRALAIGHGPGSFTGLRVAVNAAKSLGYALNLKTYALDTHDILVHGVTRRDLPILVLINAQKNAFFSAAYRYDGKTWVQTRALELTEFDQLPSLLDSPHLCVGDGFLELGSLETSNLAPDLKSKVIRDTTISDYPSATILGQMVEGLAKTPAPLVWNEVQALYIRASGAEENLKRNSRV